MRRNVLLVDFYQWIIKMLTVLTSWLKKTKHNFAVKKSRRNGSEVHTDVDLSCWAPDEKAMQLNERTPPFQEWGWRGAPVAWLMSFSHIWRQSPCLPPVAMLKQLLALDQYGRTHSPTVAIVVFSNSTWANFWPVILNNGYQRVTAVSALVFTRQERISEI